MTSDEVLELFKSTGALLEGHFILTSGYHSPYYFQCAKVLQYPRHNKIFAAAISRKFNNKDINVVVFPQSVELSLVLRLEASLVRELSLRKEKTVK